ncbi:hypothetical protein [Iningainema tapete]|uniref:Uncharacterized protein n=1 Tax=Iningainema tapete BLCC-T55 TaxID=2748662 RepID=A0A8J7CAP5_9CYAN|nr:hypothetical protein [Iningainema tapete]MBD2771510.1 hypothetical protein [Iningainema tapete BLCC-T55]
MSFSYTLIRPLETTANIGKIKGGAGGTGGAGVAGVTGVTGVVEDVVVPLLLPLFVATIVVVVVPATDAITCVVPPQTVADSSTVISVNSLDFSFECMVNNFSVAISMICFNLLIAVF